MKKIKMRKVSRKRQVKEIARRELQALLINKFEDGSDVFWERPDTFTDEDWKIYLKEADRLFMAFFGMLAKEVDYNVIVDFDHDIEPPKPPMTVTVSPNGVFTIDTGDLGTVWGARIYTDTGDPVITTTPEVADLRKKVALLEKQVADKTIQAANAWGERDELVPIVEALQACLEFYADPETYHAISFMFDPPCGDFAEDFDTEHGNPDYANREMPGTKARRCLNDLRAWGDYITPDPDKGQ